MSLRVEVWTNKTVLTPATLQESVQFK